MKESFVDVVKQNDRYDKIISFVSLFANKPHCLVACFRFRNKTGIELRYMKPPSTKKNAILVGGFNPFEQILVRMGIFPK